MTIPFLVNYEPYVFPVESTPVYNINDMVSISSTLPEKIDYQIGTLEDLSSFITIQNLTTNAALEVTVTFNKSALIINTPDTMTPMVFTINPSNQQQLSIKLNKEILDTNTKYDPIEGNINFSIKNLVNGTVVFKNV